MSPRLSRMRRVLLPGALATVLTAGATVGLASVGVSSAGAASGRILVPAGAQAIPGSYIVVFKNAAAAVRTAGAVNATARSLAAAHGATVTRTYTAALRGFAARASVSQARALAADPSVAYVEQDTKVSVRETQNGATWGLDRIDQRNLPLNQQYTYDTRAPGVTAYIIDTGIQTSHPEFEGRASVGTDTVGDGRNGQDCHGHGTHVAGTVGSRTYGVAKGVTLKAVRVLNCRGSGTNSGVIDGVDWVTQHAAKPAVANMSLGGGASSALDNAVRSSIAAGVTYALAAGNESQNACNVSPARTQEAITVGATTSSDTRASFSNYGSCVDIFAPGSGITSTWTGNGTNTISGTSMASPHVCGAAALYLAAHPASTPAQVAAGLVAAATSGVVGNPGSGSPNKLLYTRFGGTPPPPPPPPPPPGKYFENTTDVAIPDYPGPAVESPITVSGIPGNAPAALKVSVDIKHTYRGDLVVQLVAPDGSGYTLSNRSGGSADNIIETYTVNASSEAAGGTWKLRVQDRAWWDTGLIDKWSLQF